MDDTTLIGDVVKIAIFQTESVLLCFAIDAPKEISIFLEELYKGKRILKNQNVVCL